MLKSCFISFRFAILGIFVCIFFTIGSYSCKKEGLDGNALPHLDEHNNLIEQAKSHFMGAQPRTSGDRDTVDLFYAFDLDWGLANIEAFDSSQVFVRVPVSIDDPMLADSLSADMVFYNGPCGLSMELWIFPSFNTFLNDQKIQVQNGCVAVLNNCHKNSQIFYIKNGVTIDVDTLILEKSQVTASDRTKEPKCPRWGDTIWDRIGAFLGGVGTFFNGLWGWFTGLEGGGNSGGWSGTYYSWSGLGSWSPSSGFTWGGGGGNGNGTGNPGGGNNPQYIDPHITSKAKARIKETYGLDLDIEILIQLFGIDCIVSIGSTNLPAGSNYQESACVEAVLEDNDLVRAYFISEFLTEYDLDVPLPLLLALAQDCPPIYGYEAFKNCLVTEITAPLFTEFLQDHNQSAPAQAFITNILPQITQHNLFFLTMDDLNFLFDQPGFYAEYKQYLQQTPNASETAKLTTLRMVVEAPKDPIPDLSTRLNCFDLINNQNNAQFQSIALYIDQPIANSNKPVDDRSGPVQKIVVGPGHTWISITQIINGQNITLNVGLYPSTSLHSLLSQPTSGAFNNDTEHDFDVFVRWENPPDSIFDDLIANLKTYSSAPNYDLDDFNCSTWAVKELEKIGYIVPQTIVNFGGGAGYGLCPAQLGQDLRANQPPNTYMNPAGGSGPSTTCQ